MQEFRPFEPVVPSVLPAPGRGAYLLGGGYVLFDLLAIAAELLFWHRLLVAMFDTAAWYWSGLWGVFAALDAPVCRLGFFCCAEGEVSDGDDFIYLPPEQDGATVRHILKAALHVSSHAISR